MSSKRTNFAAALLAVALSGACAKKRAPEPVCPMADDCPRATTETRAHELRPPPHGQHHDGACALASDALSDEVRGSIARALADERRAESEYEQLAVETGPRRLAHIARSEARHALELERLLIAHGHPVPPGSTELPPVRAASTREACALGAASEKRNIALYDALLTGPLPADVRCVFERLRAASATRHLPAFERCAGR